MVRTLRLALLLPLALTLIAPACGDDRPADPAEADAGVGPDATGVGPDARDDEDPDADADPPEPGPWPEPPLAGQFGWANLIAGVGDQVVMAVAPDGGIFVAGDHTGAIDAGPVQLAAPQHQAIVVLRLSAFGTPLWARSFDGADRVSVRTLAIAPGGDVVIGGVFTGAAFDLGLGPIASAGNEDGYLLRLAGATGAVSSAIRFGSTLDDVVASTVFGPDGELYVYGQLGRAAEVAGEAFAPGAFLARFDGAQRAWAHSYDSVRVDYQGPLALDPQRGPVIAGTFYRTLVLGDHHLATDPGDDYTEGDGFVAGFTRAGEVRFATHVADASTIYARALAVSPGGDVYLAAGIRGPIDVDGHTTWSPDHTFDPYLLRLTPEGRYAWSTVLHGARDNSPRGLAVDDAGAVYLIASCDGQVDLHPTIACPLGGGVVVSYGPDNAYRWSTFIGPAWVEAIAPGVAGRVIVAGAAPHDTTIDFGGVPIAGSGVFVASLATGPAPLPSPLPPVPVITAAAVDGAPDRQVRHGSTATLRLEGAGLDQVSSARLGGIELYVPPSTATALTLTVAIPHGHPTGLLPLVLGNAAGTTEWAGAVQVTPVVVAPSGTATGRGTFASPLRLCRDSWFGLADRGDVLLLRTGVHACDDDVSLRRGVIVRGESTSGTIVRGPSSGRPFAGFWAGFGGFGTTVIESLTIDATEGGATVRLHGGNLTMRDVTLRGAGVTLDSPGTTTLSRIRYLAGTRTGVMVRRGTVVADHLDLTTIETGVYVVAGELRLADSVISAGRIAIQAGSANDHADPQRQVEITGTTLRAGYQAVIGFNTALDLDDVTIESSSPQAWVGVDLSGGVARLADTSITGFDEGVRLDNWNYEDEARDVSGTLEDVTIDAREVAIDFSPRGSPSHLRLRGTRATSALTALRIWGVLDSVDLGTEASPGDNRLVSSSGGLALDDWRADLGPAIDAHGTTFNGEAFTGAVTGAVEVPGRYRIAGPNTIRF